MNKEHEREIARKNQQNQALEEQIQQLKIVFAEKEGEVSEQNGWLQYRVAELEEAYQDVELRLNTNNVLLNADEREIVDTLCHAGEWIQDQAKTTERNKAWTKEMVIHVLTLAQQVEALEPFLAKPKTGEEHQAKK
ncbi:hypothetical protein V6N11_001518 [Hibiscus sabdariffa]|uniref:Uncharacterized protein n=2 Tax=Hibiscus sabdariffa TaxID=183260 RepID=A0ABR1Z755_9ROSI